MPPDAISSKGTVQALAGRHWAGYEGTFVFVKVQLVVDYFEYLFADTVQNGRWNLMKYCGTCKVKMSRIMGHLRNLGNVHFSYVSRTWCLSRLSKRNSEAYHYLFPILRALDVRKGLQYMYAIRVAEIVCDVNQVKVDNAVISPDVKEIAPPSYISYTCKEPWRVLLGTSHVMCSLLTPTIVDWQGNHWAECKGTWMNCSDCSNTVPQNTDTIC